MTKGVGLFQGVSKDSSSLGKNLPEIMKHLFDTAVPDLYPKLEMGARPLTGKEAEQVLKAANLTALPQVFYAPPEGLDLVVKKGSKYLPNPEAEIVTEIFNFIKGKSDYGETVNGKLLESHFGGLRYGWERDMLRLVLAVLMRAGSIAVTHQGRRYTDYRDAEARAPFITNPTFRAASFVPHKPLDLKTLTTAVKHFQKLTGYR